MSNKSPIFYVDHTKYKGSKANSQYNSGMLGILPDIGISIFESSCFVWPEDSQLFFKDDWCNSFHETTWQFGPILFLLETIGVSVWFIHTYVYIYIYFYNKLLLNNTFWPTNAHIAIFAINFADLVGNSVPLHNHVFIKQLMPCCKSRTCLEWKRTKVAAVTLKLLNIEHIVILNKYFALYHYCCLHILAVTLKPFDLNSYIGSIEMIPSSM